MTGVAPQAGAHHHALIGWVGFEASQLSIAYGFEEQPNQPQRYADVRNDTDVGCGIGLPKLHRQRNHKHQRTL